MNKWKPISIAAVALGSFTLMFLHPSLTYPAVESIGSTACTIAFIIGILT